MQQNDIRCHISAEKREAVPDLDFSLFICAVNGYREPTVNGCSGVCSQYRL